MYDSLGWSLDMMELILNTEVVLNNFITFHKMQNKTDLLRHTSHFEILPFMFILHFGLF